jgi:hypothetical protein
VQYHGGVPVTSIWTSARAGEIVCFHFSGASPLTMLGIHDFSIMQFLENPSPPSTSDELAGPSPLPDMGGHSKARVWGCQIEKFFVRKSWNEQFDEGAKSLANSRAEYAFKLWLKYFREAIAMVQGRTPLDLALKPLRSCPVLCNSA